MGQFKVGDHAVYPGHGVGRISSIEYKEILGAKHEFYSVQILETGMKIMIPAANIKSVGLRPLISKEEAQKVVDILKDKNVKIDTQTWNRRYRDYMEKIKTGSVYEIAEVLRDLYVLKVDKELSFGEKKMLDTAKNLLLKELNLAPDVNNVVNSDAEIKAIFGVQ
ncbi:MAG: CarD family transcriptional regulator [Bdellovibrio sp.]|nr:CarD family transcriptional regulator [Bdellovibrio sp.]